MDDKGITVLLVDDEKDFRDLLNFWLASRGYDVIVASNGQEAVRVCRESNPDIIFLDLNMPVMGGLEALVKIREFNPVVPVIIISAYIDDKKTKEATHYGVSGVFYKGENFESALPLLEAALRTHKQLKK